MTKKTTKTGPQKEPDPYALRRLVKPDFVHVCMENQTFYRVPGVIPAADRLALIDALPKRLNDATKAPFVDAVLLDAEVKLKIRDNQLPKSIQSEVKDLEKKARELLAAMTRVQPNAMSIFEAFGLEVAYFSSQTSEAFTPGQTGDAVEIRQKIGQTADLTKAAFAGPSGAGMSKLWDVVQDIETIAHVAAANITPQRGKRPSDSLSKAITHDAARQYKLSFSTFPPLTESGWFAVWLSDLGGKLGHPFSAKQAATALAQWRAYQDPAGKVPG